MTGTTVTLSRSVPASPGRVFELWTNASRLARWWWPQLPGTTYVVDARVGGSYAIASPVIGATVRGDYSEVEPPRRLVFTWNWEDDDGPAVGEDTVAVDFEPEHGATLVTVAHTSQAHAPDDGTEQGWNDVLERLAGLLGSARTGQSTSSRS